jgi:hypothetical protein
MKAREGEKGRRGEWEKGRKGEGENGRRGEREKEEEHVNVFYFSFFIFHFSHYLSL